MMFTSLNSYTQFFSSKSSQRALEELQRTMNDLEAKYKSELSRLKKKYETEIREHEIQIDTLNRNNAELNKANKSLAARLKVRPRIQHIQY